MQLDEALELTSAVRRVAMRFRGLVGRSLADLGLTHGQEVVLFELSAHGSRTQSQLAVAAGCEPPTMTLTVRKLESAGLVRRSPSATDGRAVVVELTDTGRELVPALESTWRDLAERTVGGLSHTSTATLVRTLDDLAASIDSLSPGSGECREGCRG